MLLLYFWSALVGFGGAALAVFSRAWVLFVLIVAGVAVGVVLLVVPRVQARRRTARTKREEAAREQRRLAQAAAGPPNKSQPAQPASEPHRPSANGSRRSEGDLSRPTAL